MFWISWLSDYSIDVCRKLVEKIGFVCRDNLVASWVNIDYIWQWAKVHSKWILCFAVVYFWWISKAFSWISKCIQHYSFAASLIRRSMYAPYLGKYTKCKNWETVLYKSFLLLCCVSERWEDMYPMFLLFLSVILMIERRDCGSLLTIT